MSQQPAAVLDARDVIDAEGDGLAPAARRWAILSVQIGVGMASLDTAIANTALPAIAAQLHTTPAASVWIINVYQLAMVATLLPLAALGEIIGYRRVCLAGLVLFTLASLGCAMAWSLPSLVVARLFQGVGAAAIMGVNSAMLGVIYPKRLLGRGFGTNAMVVAVAVALGPTAASLILATASWPWLFAINVPLGIVAVLLGRRVLPVTKRASHAVDGLTAIYNVGAFGLLILAAGDAAHQASITTLLPELAGSMIFFALMLRRQAGHAAPTLPVAIMAPIAGRLSDRYQPGLLGGVGTAVLSAGLLSLIWMPPHPSVFDIGWRMAVCGFGFGFFQAPNLKAIMSSAPPERSGGASGIVATARLIGQSSGAALVAYCFTLSSTRGTTYALVLAVVVSALASVASFSRLFVKPAR